MLTFEHVDFCERHVLVPLQSHAKAGAAGFSFTVVPTARPKRKSGRRKKNTYLALAAIFLIRHVETSR